MVYKIPPGGGGKPYLASGLISIHFKWFFLNVLILKLYKRNIDLQMDTQYYYRIASALVSALTIRTQMYGCSYAGKADGLQYKSYSCNQYI